jgi:pyruvate dehydrogenase E1 component alpha subunit
MSSALLLDDARTLLRQMLRIRRFEEACAQLYGAGRIRGFLHLAIGQEAAAVGAMAPLREQDNVVATYREHGHALARGLDMNAVMAELFGREQGCCRGRGGSMHLFDVRRRFYGGNAIVAGHLPVAAGLALAQRLQRGDGITACLFGEGAVAEGEFHEAANLAALWRLPLLLLCENNLYAMGTALARSESQVDLCAKARSYRMDAVSVDGMNVSAVRDAVRRAADRLRAGDGPLFLELRTYRFRGHSMYDPDQWRDKAEVEAWKQRCPIEAFARHLAARGRAGDVEALEREVAAEVAAATAYAEAGSLEPVEALTRDLVAPD